MKKTKKLMCLLVLLISISLIGVFSLAGCKEEAAEEEAVVEEEVEEEAAPAEEDQTDTPMGTGTVYYLLPELLGPAQIIWEEQNKKHGEDLGYKVITLNANNQVSEQLRQLDDAIAQNPKAIILNAVDASTVSAAVDNARENGIKILAQDRFIADVKIDFTTAFGTIKMGEMGAEECLRMLKEKYGEEKGVILEVMGDTGDNYSVTIHQGFKSITDEYPNIDLITKDTPGWETTATVDVVNDQLTVRDDIDVIFIHWDGRVTWIYPVLEEKGYSKGDIKICGTDGSPEALDMIREGWSESAINAMVYEEAYGNWVFMDEVLSNEEIVTGKYDILGTECELINEEWGPTLYLPGTIINKDNVDDPELWGNFTVEE